MKYKLSTFGISDTGLVRTNNEDRWIALPEIDFIALADGMGGHVAGEIAAQEAIDSLTSLMQETFNPEKKPLTLDRNYQIVFSSLEKVNKKVFERSWQNNELTGMGTTLCCLRFHPEGVIIGHVGDSRIYRLRNHRLKQLTEDHSLLTEILEKNQTLIQEEINYYKNIVTKAIGTEPSVHPTVTIDHFLDNDICLLCSDGLTDLVNNEEIEEILKQKGSIKQCSVNNKY